MMVLLPLLNIEFPTDAVFFYSLVSKSSSFELLPTAKIYEKVYGYTDFYDESSDFGPKSKLMGLSQNIIENLVDPILYY
jgi:hypothetical protein